MKLKNMLHDWRIIIMLILVGLAIVAIHPVPWHEGAAIRSVVSNSSASDAGFLAPKPTSTPTSRERILQIDSNPIKTVTDYENVIKTLSPDQTIQIETDRGFYSLHTRYKTILVNKTVNATKTSVVEKRINGTLTNVTTTRYVMEVQEVPVEGTELEPLGFSVYEAPVTNLRKGLDLQGGTRVLLTPQEKLSPQDLDTLLENLKQRLNVFGLSDVIVRSATDLTGEQFIIVEIAGASEEDVKELLAKQGKFESRIGNQTVFKGGSDVKYVCRSADCSGIDARSGGCGADGQGGYACRFTFSISLSQEAAQRQADATRPLKLAPGGTSGDRYLDSPIVLYLDDKEVDRLNIAEDLRGRAVTDISISGSGNGKTQQEAVTNALENMKRLQTILITGSLPVKLNIVDLETVSPTLGETFLQTSILVGMLSLLVVGVIIFIRYRTLKLSIPIMFTCAAEVVLIMGFASVVGWNLDLAAIAAIIIAIGTGVDHQVVIADETLRKDVGAQHIDWKARFKNAMFIIISAFFTTASSMAVLYFAGAGLLKGFAITTIAGLALGVFITRPAYASMLQILIKED